MKVYIARFQNERGRYAITEGDPRDRHWTNYVGGQKLHPGGRLNEMYRSLSAGDITDLRVQDMEVFGPMGQPVSFSWEGYRCPGLGNLRVCEGCGGHGVVAV